MKTIDKQLELLSLFEQKALAPDDFVDRWIELRKEYLPTLEKRSVVLVEDLKILLDEAEAGEFGDFTNEKYPAPKVALAQKLYNLRENVIHGKYD